ncbi:hypothetical protein EYF80_058812 [Liparis tanakae]|uniref:Uncharacterized protein n=1 Tax=Liparis tanakae TaxID=230148 RepID=A0A4Z2EQ43_9TELE|nr:hypothetical protein EYF80_058812 [Liparis tanakae]
MEWRKQDKGGREGGRGKEGKREGGRARGREWGSAARLNDVFQEEQSSLSNRRLRNESAYLFGGRFRIPPPDKSK